MKFWNAFFVLGILFVLLVVATDTTPNDRNAAAALFSFLGLLIYFIPSYVATRRGVLNAAPLQVVNLFLGWTFIGWIVALVMATGAKTRFEYASEHPTATAPKPMKVCSQCAEEVQAAAMVCRYCGFEFPPPSNT